MSARKGERAHNFAKVTRPCDGCGALLSRSPSHFRAKAFCSISCKGAHARRPVECSGCRKPFARVVGNPATQYCSWDCFKQSRHIVLACCVCRSWFDSYLSEHRKRVARGHKPCCSRACRNSLTSTLLGGDGTWSPGRYAPKQSRGTAWRKARVAYMKSVGGWCEGCTSAKAVDVHHLHPISDGGDLLSFDNLMACCRSCHDGMHQQLRAGAFWDSVEEARRSA